MHGRRGIANAGGREVENVSVAQQSDKIQGRKNAEVFITRMQIFFFKKACTTDDGGGHIHMGVLPHDV